MLPVKLGPVDCHLAIWNKSPDSWHRANCEDPDSWIVPNSHLLRRDQTVKWKSTSQRPSMVLSFLQPKHCQRGKEEMCIDSVLKGGKILNPLHSSMSLGSWKCSDIKKKKKSNSPWQQNCHARNTISTYTGKHLKNTLSEEEELKFQGANDECDCLQTSIDGGGREGWERKIQISPLMGSETSVPVCLLIT